jgi:hypothetical protein
MPEALRFWILKWFVLAIDSAEIVQGQFMYPSICAVLNYPIVIYRTRSFLCNIPSIYNIGDFLLGIIYWLTCYVCGWAQEFELVHSVPPHITSTVMYGPLKHHRPLKQCEFPGRAFPPLTSNFLVLEYMVVYINLMVI